MSFTHGQSVRLINNEEVPSVPVNSIGTIAKIIPSNITFQELKDAVEALNSFSDGCEVVDFSGIGKGIKVVPLYNNPLEELE